MKTKKHHFITLFALITFLNILSISNSSAEVYMAVDENAYEHYGNDPATNVETRIYKYWDVKPHPMCSMQLVSNPSGIKQCAPIQE